tara:strand:- start:263 stop:514 length:252 start_codon:yes stop_codon:yes gene_type:complete
MAKEKGKQWDGKSRVSNETYRQNWDDIFNQDKRTYQKKIDHSNDITFENEIKKEKTTSELLREGYEEEKKMLEEEDGITEETN